MLRDMPVQVTAPVRETSAQALGVAAAPLTSAAAGVVVKLLEQLQAQAEWDVRCGASAYLEWPYNGLDRFWMVRVLVRVRWSRGCMQWAG